MSHLKNLMDSAVTLGKSISEFPIRAVSLDDFMSTEEKIKNMRETLKHLNARLLIVKAQSELKTADEASQEDEENTVEDFHKAATQLYISNKLINLCLHSNTIQDIAAGKEGTPEIQKKIYASMRKLFTLNDSILSVQEATESALQRQVDLNIECRNALYKYKNFLEEQEKINNKRLQETNPEIARNKEKMNLTIQKINVMKKLITNFIATSGSMLMKEPILVEMLETHRKSINRETILKMVTENDT